MYGFVIRVLNKSKIQQLGNMVGNMDSAEIKRIIEEGKLKTYHQGAGFIDVYWSHPELGSRSFYLFKFLAANDSFIGVHYVNPSRLPIKQNPKIHKKSMEGLVRGLVS